jgi:hypothetical protein
MELPWMRRHWCKGLALLDEQLTGPAVRRR